MTFTDSTIEPGRRVDRGRAALLSLDSLARAQAPTPAPEALPAAGEVVAA